MAGVIKMLDELKRQSSRLSSSSGGRNRFNNSVNSIRDNEWIASFVGEVRSAKTSRGEDDIDMESGFVHKEQECDCGLCVEEEKEKERVEKEAKEIELKRIGTGMCGLKYTLMYDRIALFSIANVAMSLPLAKALLHFELNPIGLLIVMKALVGLLGLATAVVNERMWVEAFATLFLIIYSMGIGMESLVAFDPVMSVKKYCPHIDGPFWHQNPDDCADKVWWGVRIYLLVLVLFTGVFFAFSKYYARRLKNEVCSNEVVESKVI